MTDTFKISKRASDELKSLGVYDYFVTALRNQKVDTPARLCAAFPKIPSEKLTTTQLVHLINWSADTQHIPDYERASTFWHDLHFKLLVRDYDYNPWDD